MIDALRAGAEPSVVHAGCGLDQFVAGKYQFAHQRHQVVEYAGVDSNRGVAACVSIGRLVPIGRNCGSGWRDHRLLRGCTRIVGGRGIGLLFTQLQHRVEQRL